MVYAIVILLPVLVLLVAWLLRGDWRPSPEVKIVRTPSSDGTARAKPGTGAGPAQWAALLDELDRLGFYDDIPADSRAAAKQQDLDARWPFAHEPNTLLPADAEEIAEGGAGAWIRENAAALAAHGVRRATVRDLEEDGARVLEVDGRRFVISSPDAHYAEAWRVAVERFLAAVNELLASAGSAARLYWISGAEDGNVALLRPEVHRAITQARLLPPRDWTYED